MDFGLKIENVPIDDTLPSLPQQFKEEAEWFIREISNLKGNLAGNPTQAELAQRLLFLYIVPKLMDFVGEYEAADEFNTLYYAIKPFLIKREYDWDKIKSSDWSEIGADILSQKKAQAILDAVMEMMNDITLAELMAAKIDYLYIAN